MKLNYKKLYVPFKALETKLDKRRKLFLDGRETFVISEMEMEIHTHPAYLQTVKELLQLYQLSNNPRVFKRLSLLDIEKNYEELSKIMEDDIDLNLEYYFFLKNVMDKEVQAKKHIISFKKKVLKKIRTALKSE